MLTRAEGRKLERTTQAMAQPTILTVQEVAAYLRLHTVTVYRMAQNGDLPAFRVGRRWRFKRDQIEQWLADRQATSAAASSANLHGPSRTDHHRSGRS